MEEFDDIKSGYRWGWKRKRRRKEITSPSLIQYGFKCASVNYAFYFIYLIFSFISLYSFLLFYSISLSLFIYLFFYLSSFFIVFFLNFYLFYFPSFNFCTSLRIPLQFPFPRGLEWTMIVLLLLLLFLHSLVNFHSLMFVNELCFCSLVIVVHIFFPQISVPLWSWINDNDSVAYYQLHISIPSSISVPSWSWRSDDISVAYYQLRVPFRHQFPFSCDLKWWCFCHLSPVTCFTPPSISVPLSWMNADASVNYYQSRVPFPHQFPFPSLEWRRLFLLSQLFHHQFLSPGLQWVMCFHSYSCTYSILITYFFTYSFKHYYYGTYYISILLILLNIIIIMVLITYFCIYTF